MLIITDRDPKVFVLICGAVFGRSVGWFWFRTKIPLFFANLPKIKRGGTSRSISKIYIYIFVRVAQNAIIALSDFPRGTPTRETRTELMVIWPIRGQLFISGEIFAYRAAHNCAREENKTYSRNSWEILEYDWSIRKAANNLIGRIWGPNSSRVDLHSRFPESIVGFLEKYSLENVFVLAYFLWKPVNCKHQLCRNRWCLLPKGRPLLDLARTVIKTGIYRSELQRF